MSEYERRAWEQLKDQAQRRQDRKVLSPKVRKAIGEQAGRAADAIRKVPGAEFAEAKLSEALEGLRGLTMDAAMGSVSAARVFRKYEALGVTGGAWEQIRALDLSDCDATMPDLRLRYATATAIEGAAASLAITGAEVATTVSGGTTAAVAVGAVAVDISAVLAAMGRVVAETGAYYGYDVDQEDERLFALAVIAYSSAATPAAKAASLAELSKLTQMMMRRATWKQLSSEPLVKVIQFVYARLGIRLTKTGLSKAVPILGVVVGAGMNAAALQKVATDAKFAYRMRMLVDKYGLDSSEITADLVPEADLSGEDVIRLDLDEPDLGDEHDHRDGP
jgi:hypothetical protein